MLLVPQIVELFNVSFESSLVSFFFNTPYFITWNHSQIVVISDSFYLIGSYFVDGKFLRKKIFVGKNFRQLLKISSLFADEYFSMMYWVTKTNVQVFREIKAENTVKHQ